MDNKYHLVQKKYQELQQFPEIVQKYDKPGIYSISIEGQLVYIGKSVNCLQRLAAHIINTQENNKGHKYAVFRDALRHNYSISFGMLYQAQSQDIENELGEMEGRYIREYLPCLNTQIPKEENWHKFVINQKAKIISLNTILAGQSNKK